MEVQMALKQRAHRPMGTTILSLIMGISKVSIFNVGDNKGYTLRDNDITPLTVDDRSHHGRSKDIIRCLGEGLERQNHTNMI